MTAIRAGEDWASYVTRAGSDVASVELVDQAMDALLDAIVRMQQQITALEARHAELESRTQKAAIGAVTWAGVFTAGCEYREGSLTTRAGSLWVARCLTRTSPGDPGSDWTLA